MNMQISKEPGISLADALGVKRGAVVSFVGAGGKTTAMFRLAGELTAAGLRVVTTTSTHIAEDQIQLSPAYIHPEKLASLGECLDRHGQCLVAGLPDGKGRVFNISPQVILDLKKRPDVDCILIEADGSKSRPFKAPAPHEPVVLDMTTILVPIVGMNCIGRPLDDVHVHRPEIAAVLADVQVGSTITPEIVARVLSHADGGAKGLPPGARLAPLLNKVDTGDMRYAEEIAAKLMKHSNVDSILVGSVDRDPPILKVWILKEGSA
ncbi:MAG: putative selenium-dependent hydroxylase accessory protein YqeC [Acidobacteria bacterium]|nr:putative selenium-dependent hydroxylase accessory protein YqeC [Acidobacteriota bacterium]